MQQSSNLEKKIIDKSAVVCIIGLGQVGLPTSLCILNSGYKVLGIDTNEGLINLIRQGKSPIPEAGLDALIKKYIDSTLLQISSSSKYVSVSDIIIICVPTPLNENTMKADLTFLLSALKTVYDNIRENSLVIVESTLPPETMKKMVIPILKGDMDGHEGKNVFISYCPERISPGNTLEEFANNDRLVGANDLESTNLSIEFMSKITKGTIHKAPDTTSAEISKLAENSYRDLNIAFANELAMICEDFGSDVVDVIKLANTHPRVNIHRPGPGVGGPCLPKDPYLLISNTQFPSLIKSARERNNSMPTYIVDVFLNITKDETDRKSMNILILGASYKPGVNDTRYSPSKDIVSLLKSNGFEKVFLHDQYSQETFGALPVETEFFSELPKFDCIIAITGHQMYTEIKSVHVKDNCLILDAARIFDKTEFLGKEIVLYSLGSSRL